MRHTIRPLIGAGPVVPVTEWAVAHAEAFPWGGTVYVDEKGRPVLLVPYVPLQVSRITPCR